MLRAIAMTDSANTIYEFGPFRMNPERYLLLRDEQAIPLSPKVFETLLFLVRTRGRAARKDEIFSSVWPDTFVEESNLAQNIFLLRKALGEEKNEHRYIVTVPGVGYRFVAPVRESTVPRAVSEEPAGQSVTSIAVLPFKTLTGEDEDKFLGPGLADALIMRLSSIRFLKVRPTAAVLRYNFSREDPLQVGFELNVDALLDGVYQRETDKIRVSVQLISVKERATLWAAKFEERITDIFAIQDSISEQVVNALALQLSGDEQRRLKQGYTHNSEAFQLFVKGRYFWNQRSTAGLRKALECAEQAIAIDPTYAPAYVALADAYNLLGAQHNVLPPRESFPKARAAALRALEIDEMMPEAYASLAFINCYYEWDCVASEQSYRRAIELKPNYPTAHHWYGELLVSLGRFDEAYRELKTAQELDPLSLAINVDLAGAYFYSRQYNKSERQLLNLLDLNPNFIRAHSMLGRVLEQKGEYKRAIEELQCAVRLSDDPVTRAMLAHVYASAGETDKARDILEMLEESAEETYVSSFHIATIHIAFGNNEMAYRWLDRAVENRDIDLYWLKVSPVFDPIRHDRQFADLVRRVSPALL